MATGLARALRAVKRDAAARKLQDEFQAQAVAPLRKRAARKAR
jgi:hypothetical protein